MTIDRSGFGLALPLGLGCSRLGSVLGPGNDAATALIAAALDQGIRFFDTAAIYAQGDSERLLGRALGRRQDCIICSKVGQQLPLPNPALIPIKRLARLAAARSPAARRLVAKARAQLLPRNWSPNFLAEAIEASLRRLGRDQVDIMLLHGPPSSVLKDGDAVNALDQARRAGKIGRIGVSADDVPSALSALCDDRVQVLQIPLLPQSLEFEPVIAKAAGVGVAVIAREVLGGPQAISGEIRPERFAAARIAELAARQELAVTLIGTTNEVHLREALGQAIGVGRGPLTLRSNKPLAKEQQLSLGLA
ncbi:aldo/keto reductase [Aquisediminimonas profunda]|uniref:aldo/keto reductase n=1 Tax=Aquisediminimonas profunda TaxID=1550733 RepID=UPI001C6345A0|nr:aldo/keto reductase [Aquisediminimonas profunda]